MQPSYFLIPSDSRFGTVSPAILVSQYINAFPASSRSGRFWFRLSGKTPVVATKKVIGINSIGSVTVEIAKFLGLDHPETYTSHTHRRTPATLLANSGASTLTLQRMGGWSSPTVAQEYVDQSMVAKLDVAHRIAPSSSISSPSASAAAYPSLSSSSSPPSAAAAFYPSPASRVLAISGGTFTNCNFSFAFPDLPDDLPSDGDESSSDDSDDPKAISRSVSSSSSSVSDDEHEAAVDDDDIDVDDDDSFPSFALFPGIAPPPPPPSPAGPRRSKRLAAKREETE
jgi:hypothetical protein